MLMQAAAAAVNAVANGAVPVADPGSALTFESYVHQAGLAAVVVYALQVMKNSKFFPWINANSIQTTKIVSWLTAFASAFAIQYSVVGSAAIGWDLHVHLPNAHDAWDDIIRIAGSKGAQTLIYNQFFNKPIEVVPVQAPPIDQQGKPIPAPAIP